VGGGTPTFTEPAALARVLAQLPAVDELTVEANPETVTRELAALLREHGVNRISVGAQSFRPALLEVLERRATPDDVRRAVHTLRDAGFDNISLDLIYGVPGQSAADLDADLSDALALEPEHLSCYELEAKPGTRFTHAHGAALARQAEALEGYFERVVETLTGAGYRWYETANFCREGDRELRALHNLGIWRGADYLGIGVGAVSTLGDERRRNLPSVGRYVSALAAGTEPPREIEQLDGRTRAVERVMLGLRLDEPVSVDAPAAASALDGVVEAGAVERLVDAGLVERRNGGIRLTPRGRMLGDAVTAEILA
jgi:oxygen-independent coproporphyrinogen-3 oxidase